MLLITYVPGWQGNGYSCQDVDECLTNNGGCSTTPMVQCLNTMGSFHCASCPPGRRGRNQSNDTSLHPPDFNGSSCVFAGYEGDGRTCTQMDICAVNNGGCYPLATCSSAPGTNRECNRRFKCLSPATVLFWQDYGFEIKRDYLEVN